MDLSAAIARIDALLHECAPAMAPAIDDEGEVSDYGDAPGSMYLNTYGLVCLYTDTATGLSYTRVFYPDNLPVAFLRGLLMDGMDTL